MKKRISIFSDTNLDNMQLSTVARSSKAVDRVDAVDILKEITMTDLKVLEFQDNPVRTIIGNDGELHWVAVDVCRAIGITKPSGAYERLDADEKGVVAGSTGDLITVNESGLYNLILRSKQPRAKDFRKWITSEVLPSIRKDR